MRIQEVKDFFGRLPFEKGFFKWFCFTCRRPRQLCWWMCFHFSSTVSNFLSGSIHKIPIRSRWRSSRQQPGRWQTCKKRVQCNMFPFLIVSIQGSAGFWLASHSPSPCLRLIQELCSLPCQLGLAFLFRLCIWWVLHFCRSFVLTNATDEFQGLFPAWNFIWK